MDPTLILLLLLTIVTVVVAYQRDRALPGQALLASARLVKGVWLELALGFVLAGLLEVLLPPQRLSEWLGTTSPTRALLIGWLAGLVIPGGPYVFFPVAANLLRHGAAPAPLIALITAKTLVSPIRMLTYEAPLLGWPMTLARLLPGLFAPPVLAIVGAWLFRLLSHKPPE